MRCPGCKEVNRDKVIDTRLAEGGTAIRRRRECLACGRRFTTKERADEEVRLTVIKKDRRRMPFDRDRILRGLQNACYKRPIPAEDLDQLARDVEEELLQTQEREIESRVIGELIGRRLRTLDKVAYIRFMSVYMNFEVDDFIEEVRDIQARSAGESPGQQSLFDIIELPSDS